MSVFLLASFVIGLLASFTLGHFYGFRSRLRQEETMRNFDPSLCRFCGEFRGHGHDEVCEKRLD